MTLFTNSNFIHHIVHSQGEQHRISKEHYPLLQTLIELETRLLIENAIKFMRKDRRDILTEEDLELAARQLNHHDLNITSMGQYTTKDEYVVKQDKVYTNPAAVMEQQLKLIANRTLEAPRLTGRWILLKGKVPNTGDNLHIKQLQQLKESGKHEYEQKRKLCNIIKDDPYSYLNAEQSAYFIKLGKIIAGDLAPTGFTVDGDLTNLMPFILKLLAQKQLNETGISFLLRLIDNPHIWRSIQYFAVKCLTLLLSYKGIQSYQVGLAISKIVLQLSSKYPAMRDIYQDYEDQSYSTILKKISFEVCLGVPFNIDIRLLEKCKIDADRNDPMAALCLRKLFENSSQLTIFQKLLAENLNIFVYWHPCPTLRKDKYLAMF